MIIDIHTHIYPDKIAAATVDKLSSGTGLYPASDGTLDGLKSAMSERGVDASFLMPVATNPEKVNKLNDFAFSVNGKDGIYSFGAMHPDCSYWKEELKRIKDNGLKGIKIHPVYQNTDIDDIRYLKIFEQCAELDIAVLAHSGNDIGFPGAERCLPKQSLNAVKQVGRFKLILAHMGGWEAWDDALEILPETGCFLDTAFSLGTYSYRNDERRESQIIERFGTEGKFIDEEKFNVFVKTFGADRILYGSDSPWQSQRAGIDYISALSITEEDKQLILGGNAKRLFM